MKRSAARARCLRLWMSVAFPAAVLIVLLSAPAIITLDVRYEQEHYTAVFDQFPVTVDPRRKVIVENDQVNTFLESRNSPLQAAVGSTGDIAHKLFTWVAIIVSEIPGYRNLAAVAGGDRLVGIMPGMRREQVAAAFASALGWTAEEKQAFLTAEEDAQLPLHEGSFAPGAYAVGAATTPGEAQTLVNDRFHTDVLAHYGTTTASIVPLQEALTVASLIEREAGGPDDMRLISGIIWNRLFIDMHLQVDATLQYVKASSGASKTWWPPVVPSDRFRPSPYNTYLHQGLPPAPIASPSVAAIVAALNPKETKCLFYFHDSAGHFHCAPTYAEHVALLKQYYGRGK